MHDEKEKPTGVVAYLLYVSFLCLFNVQKGTTKIYNAKSPL